MINDKSWIDFLRHSRLNNFNMHWEFDLNKWNIS